MPTTLNIVAEAIRPLLVFLDSAFMLRFSLDDFAFEDVLFFFTMDDSSSNILALLLSIGSISSILYLSLSKG